MSSYQRYNVTTPDGIGVVVGVTTEELAEEYGESGVTTSWWNDREINEDDELVEVELYNVPGPDGIRWYDATDVSLLNVEEVEIEPTTCLIYQVVGQRTLGDGQKLVDVLDGFPTGEYAVITFQKESPPHIPNGITARVKVDGEAEQLTPTPRT